MLVLSAVNKSSEPQVSTTMDSLKRSSSVLSSTANDRISVLSREPSSASKQPSNEIVNILKRPLLNNKPSKNSENKKIKLTEQKNTKEQNTNSSKSNIRDNKTNISTKLNNQTTNCVKNKDNKNVEVFVEVIEDNIETTGTITNHVDDKVHGVSSKKLTVIKSKKNGNSKAVVTCNEKESSTTSNIIIKTVQSISQIEPNDSDATSNNVNNKIVNVNSSEHVCEVLQTECDVLSTDTLVTVDNSNAEDINDQTEIENNLNTSNTSIPEQSNPNIPNTIIINKVETVSHKGNDNDNDKDNDKVMEVANDNNDNNDDDNDNDDDGNDDDDDDDDDLQVIDSDSDVDMHDTTNLADETEIKNILNGISNVNETNFTILLQLFNKENVTFQQFESFLLQKILEFMTDTSDQGKLREKVDLLLRKEKIWRAKFELFHKQIKELKTVIKMHKEDLEKNPYAKPHIVTRTVGLQALVGERKDSPKVQLLKSIMPGLEISDHSCSATVSDDDGDYVANNNNGSDIVNINNTADTSQQPSCSKTIVNTTPKKQLCSPSKAVTTKAVPPALPLPVINNISTIDLTDDVIDVLPKNNICLTKTPVKISPRPPLNAVVTQGSQTLILTRNSSIQAVPKSVTYLTPITPNITSTPNLIMRPTTLARSPELLNSPNTTNNSVKSTRPIIIKKGKFMSLNISPAQLQPVNVAYTTTGHRVQSQLIESLQPVPAAIPIIKHPAPLPSVSNQRSHSTWRKLPPAPSLTATFGDGPNSKALLLTWNLQLNRTIADITTYQIYAYHETPGSVPNSDLWRKIGDVNALPLPMACSLSQFSFGQKYHFAVRAVDVYARYGPFSSPEPIFMNR